MGKVINFSQKRKEFVERKRLSLEQLAFKNFLSIYAVLPESRSLYEVRALDISYKGMSFEIPFAGLALSEDAEQGEEDLSRQEARIFEGGGQVQLRFYFTNQTYVPAILGIKHKKRVIDSNQKIFIQYGGEFDQSLNSFFALDAFIRFLYKFAEHSIQENEARRVHFL